MAKKISVTLPKGAAVWPKLNEVDVYQPVDKKGKPSGAEKRRFITRLEFNDEDHRKVDAYLRKQLADNDMEGGKLPWRDEKKDGKKTGKKHLEMTSGEKFPPPFIDSKGNDIPRSKVKIGGGSILKINVTVNPYTGFGGGINLYMNDVMIVELKQRVRNQIEAEENGFVYDGNASGDDSEDLDDTSAPESPSNQDTDDDIPF
ncbi:MAG: hypothetical protein ACHP7H_00440 [Hyphomicrobiales bacterium]